MSIENEGATNAANKWKRERRTLDAAQVLTGCQTVGIVARRALTRIEEIDAERKRLIACLDGLIELNRHREWTDEQEAHFGEIDHAVSGR